jgi:hypothetical protein
MTDINGTVLDSVDIPDSEIDRVALADIGLNPNTIPAHTP